MKTMFNPTYNKVTSPVPVARASGSVRSGCFSSSATYVAAFQPLKPTITQSRLIMNWTGIETVDVRTAGWEKCSQLPDPAMNPRITNEAMTTSLVPVSTFCTLAVRLTPKQFRIVNAPISAEASNWAPPNCNESAPEPIVNCALACLKTGKKYPT